MDTKLITVAAIASLVGAGSVYVSTDGGETLAKVVLEAPVPSSDLLAAALPACFSEIAKVNNNPSCALVTAYYPIGGKLRYPELVYEESGVAAEPSLAEMRELNFTSHEVWACSGAVMPSHIQGCLDDAQVAVEVARAEAK